MGKKKNNLDILNVAKKLKKGDAELLQQRNVQQALDEYGKKLTNKDKRLSTRKKVIIIIAAIIGVALISIPFIISSLKKTSYVYPFIDYNISELKDYRVKMRQGETVGHLHVEEVPGYRFDGWYSDQNYRNPLNNDAVLQNDITIYGRYIKQFSITTTIDFTNTTIIYDEGMALSEILQKEEIDINDHNSCGWFFDADLTMPFTGQLTEGLHIYTKRATLSNLLFEESLEPGTYYATLNPIQQRIDKNIVLPAKYNNGNIIGFNFSECYISNLTIPASITTIGKQSMLNSTIGSINLTTNVTTIDESAFELTNIPYVCLPSSITEIGLNAFYGSGLESIKFESCGITSIKSGTFADCCAIKNVDLSTLANLQSIEENSFYNCSNLKSVIIPKNVNSIAYETFKTCGNLETIIIDENNSTYDTRNNCNAIIHSETNALLFGCKGTIIPTTVEIIAQGAFEGCLGLNSIVIPNGVKTIENSAFENCQNLKVVNVANSVLSVGKFAFRNCIKLSQVTLSNNIQTLSEEMFAGCTSLTTLSLPESLFSIQMNAFLNSNLYNIHIPKQVNDIHLNAFQNCDNLSFITIAIENTTFDSRDNCNAIVKSESDTLYIGCNNSTVPPSIKTIGYSAFKNCTKLTSIKLPSSLTTIESYAFENCTGLTTLELPIEVTKIDAFAFKDCVNLTNVTIPTTTTKVVYYTINGITYMKTITTNDTGAWHLDNNSDNCSNTINKLDVSNSTINATLLTSTYIEYYWHKNEKTG